MERGKFESLAGGLLNRARERLSNTVTIAQVAPLTGLLASTGERMVQGGSVYFEYINATGGVHGRKIEHVVLDDGHRAAETLRITRELLRRPEVVALFGFAGTLNVSELLHEGVLQEGGAALVAPYTGGEPLRTPFNPWIFHLRAGYMDEADRIVHRAFAQGKRRFALMCSADALGWAGIDAVQAALQKRDLQLVATGYFERNTEGVDHALRPILPAHPEVIIMFSTNRTTAAFARQYRAAGGNAELYNVSILDVQEVVRLAGVEAARGMVVTQVVPSPAMLSLPAVREFHQLMKRYAPGHSVNYTNFEEFLGAKLLVEGLRRAGPHPTRAHVIGALEAIGDFDLGGITVGYSPKNRVGSRRVDFSVVDEEGELQAA
jgi:branched-chain amino acid transport system substrate-binding protein